MHVWQLHPQERFRLMRLEVLTVMSLEIQVFWDD